MFAEAILRALSKRPGTGDYGPGDEEETLGEALSSLRQAFPDFSSLVKGQRLVDFGCGFGRQAVALVLEEGCRVWGVEANPARVLKARRLAGESGIGEDRLLFVERPTADMRGACDVVVSQNAMEHFADPAAVLEEMKGLLRPQGKILIDFGPPWLSPHGSHMHFFCKVPWMNVLFSERTVMSVRARYRSDGARRYEEVESGLNRMTLKKFARLVRQSGLRIERVKYTCLARQHWMATIPGLREFVVKHVTCVLALPALVGHAYRPALCRRAASRWRRARA